jgi:hypothetical protein
MPMNSTPPTQRVNCPKCRYLFHIAVEAGSDWRVEAICPACEHVKVFTIDDTRDLPPLDREKIEAETQRLGELLFTPIRKHPSHPAIVWFDQVMNGVFEDDLSRRSWPAP